MRHLQEKYVGVENNTFSKAQFKRDAIMECPSLVTHFNSYDEVVAILKNKSILQEIKDVEYSTAKPEDLIAPDVLDTAIKCELDDKFGTLDVSPEDYEKAKEAAIKNLSKDQLYYVNKYGEQLDTPKEEMEKVVVKEDSFSSILDKALEVLNESRNEAIQNIENDERTKERISGMLTTFVSDDEEDTQRLEFAQFVNSEMENPERISDYKEIMSMDDLTVAYDNYLEINSEDVSDLSEDSVNEEDSNVVVLASKVADEFTKEDADDFGTHMIYKVGRIDGSHFELDTEATERTPEEDAKHGTGEGWGGSFVVNPIEGGYEVRNTEKGGLVATEIDGNFRMLGAEESRAELDTDYMQRRRETSDYMNEWGSSDQSAMFKSMDRALGNPKQFPGLTQIQDAAEDAVDFYMDDFEEYQTDRKGLVMDTARRYALSRFPDFMAQAAAFLGEDLTFDIPDWSNPHMKANTAKPKNVRESADMLQVLQDVVSSQTDAIEAITYLARNYSIPVKAAKLGANISEEEVDEVGGYDRHGNKVPVATASRFGRRDRTLPKDDNLEEGYSTEEKRIVQLAVNKIAKYMNVDQDKALDYVIGAAQEMRDYPAKPLREAFRKLIKEVIQG